MKFLSFAFAFFLILTAFTTTMAQQSTKVVVRVLAKDAKFIGSSMGGALVTIKNAETGELLAKGPTRGSTGDTEKLVTEPAERYEQVSTEGSSKFVAALELDKPTFVTISATGPYAKRQAHVMSSTQLWLIPGKNITGDGIILEIPGFVVDILQPQTHETVEGEEISIKANIVMMCGCPTSPDGTWDSSEYEIKALIIQEGERIDEVPLSFTGKTSTFEGSYSAAEAGSYKIVVYAFHPETGNTGLDKTAVTIVE